MLAKLNKSFYLGLSQGLIINNSFKANIKSVLVSNKNLFSQIISVDFVASVEQVKFAALQVIQLMGSNSMHLQNPSLELLLSLSGLRQLNKALELFELKNNKAILIIVGKNKEKVKKELLKLEKLVGLKKDSNLIETNFKKNKKKLMNQFNISKKELKLFENKDDALKKLIIEHNSKTVFL